MEGPPGKVGDPIVSRLRILALTAGGARESADCLKRSIPGGGPESTFGDFRRGNCLDQAEYRVRNGRAVSVPEAGRASDGQRRGPVRDGRNPGPKAKQGPRCGLSRFD